MLTYNETKTNLILNDVPNEEVLNRIQEDGKLEPNQFYETPDNTTTILFPEPDSELSAISENSIQNKAVTLELQDKVSISQAQTIYGQKVFDTRPKVGSVRLPSEFTEVEYIESTGRELIDTQITFAEFDLDFQPTSIGSSEQTYFFGNRPSSGSPRFAIMNWNSKFHFMINKTDCWNHSITTNRYLLKYRIGTLTIDDITTNTITTQNISSEQPSIGNLYLFGADFAGTKYYSSQKLYSCKMYQNNILVRDFIPCYRKLDGVIGLYDLVNNKFYTNKGTGAFLKGAELLQGEYLTLKSELPIPNNGEETTETLTSLKINNINYNIAGGSGGSSTTWHYYE